MKSVKSQRSSLVLPHTPPRSASHHSSSKGFGLIEVIITLAITSVGILGVAQMLILSQRVIMDNALRTQAILLAQDMVGRIMANSANARACTMSDYHLVFAGTSNPSNNTNCYGGTNDPITNWYRGTCSTVQVAQQDALDWQNLVAGTTLASGTTGTITQGLPGGVGFVCCTNNLYYGDPNNTACDGSVPTIANFAVKVHWQGLDGSKHRIVLVATP